MNVGEKKSQMFKHFSNRKGKKDYMKERDDPPFSIL